ncbi:MAG: hypothetical protein ACKO6A_09070, partial [Bacteroidota bacterium]
MLDKCKKPVYAAADDWLFLVERSIELSNHDDISEISRSSLIWEGLEQNQELEFGTLLGYFKDLDC